MAGHEEEMGMYDDDGCYDEAHLGQLGPMTHYRCRCCGAQWGQQELSRGALVDDDVPL
jgi:hypothetical protein